MNEAFANFCHHIPEFCVLHNSAYLPTFRKLILETLPQYDARAEYLYKLLDVDPMDMEIPKTLRYTADSEGYLLFEGGSMLLYTKINQPSRSYVLYTQREFLKEQNFPDSQDIIEALEMPFEHQG